MTEDQNHLKYKTYNSMFVAHLGNEKPTQHPVNNQVTCRRVLAAILYTPIIIRGKKQSN